MSICHCQVMLGGPRKGGAHTLISTLQVGFHQEFTDQVVVYIVQLSESGLYSGGVFEPCVKLTPNVHVHNICSKTSPTLHPSISCHSHPLLSPLFYLHVLL